MAYFVDFVLVHVFNIGYHSFEAVLVVCILSQGREGLLRIIIALLTMGKEDILQLDMEGLLKVRSRELRCCTNNNNNLF